MPEPLDIAAERAAIEALRVHPLPNYARVALCNKADRLIVECERLRICIAALEAALQQLLAAVKEPVEESCGFDHPPEYATSEEWELARSIFEARILLTPPVVEGD